MQVIQTSVLLKYSSLYSFLRRQAPAVAIELKRAYIGAARVYYETGFRRYTRSLGVIKVGKLFGLFSRFISHLYRRGLWKSLRT